MRCLCLSCGSFKTLPEEKCQSCGYEIIDTKDLAKHRFFTDKRMNILFLEKFSQEIQKGKAVKFPSKFFKQQMFMASFMQAQQNFTQKRPNWKLRLFIIAVIGFFCYYCFIK